MIYDGIKLIEGSAVQNLVIATGTAFPSSPDEGELFVRTDVGNAGLYVYQSATWSRLVKDGEVAGPTKLERVTTFDANALGKRVALSAGVTIPSGTYAVGDAFSFYNTTGSAVTITQGASLTLRQDGTANTGNRTLAPYGTCFVWFNTTNEAIISGSVS